MKRRELTLPIPGGLTGHRFLGEITGYDNNPEECVSLMMITRRTMIFMICTVDTMVGQPTVLLVEDERGLADLYARWLSGYEIRTAHTEAGGREAFDESVDIAILDRQMPDGSGDELLTDIRSTGNHCRVAMVTAAEPEVDILDLPFDDYLLKPVSERDLQETVERLRTIHEYGRAAREHFRLAKKRALLETHNPRSELEQDDQYEALVARLDELDARLDSRATALGDAEFRLLYRRADRMEPFGSTAPGEQPVTEPHR
ncbi:MAG: response regulator [Halobacteriales archaeon]